MTFERFFKFKTTCPLCNDQLHSYFISKKRKISEFNDDWYQISINLNSLRPKADYNYTAIIFINKKDNSFFVDFLKKDNSLLGSCVPLSVLRKFKEFIKAVNNLNVYRFCNSCEQYNYISNNFKLRYSESIVEELDVNLEHVNLVEPVEDGYKHYRLYNNYIDKKSEVYYAKSELYQIPRWNLDFRSPKVKTSLIGTPKTDMLDKLKKIILFS